MPESFEDKFVKKICKIMDDYGEGKITEGTAWFRTINAYNEYKKECKDWRRSIRMLLNMTKE